MGVAHGLERARAEARDVEAPILPSLDGFDEEGVCGLERAGAPEHFVGAFESLDREDRALANDAALADVEASGFAGDVDTVIEILAFDRKGLAGHATGRRHVSLKEGASVEQRDPQALDLLGNRAENGFCVAALQRGENTHGFQIGVESFEEPARGDLARHDRVAGVKLAE